MGVSVEDSLDCVNQKADSPLSLVLLLNCVRRERKTELWGLHAFLSLCS